MTARLPTHKLDLLNSQKSDVTMVQVKRLRSRCPCNSSTRTDTSFSSWKHLATIQKLDVRWNNSGDAELEDYIRHYTNVLRHLRPGLSQKQRAPGALAPGVQ
jgi:hypothetical protein